MLWPLLLVVGSGCFIAGFMLGMRGLRDELAGEEPAAPRHGAFFSLVGLLVGLVWLAVMGLMRLLG